MEVHTWFMFAFAHPGFALVLGALLMACDSGDAGSRALPPSTLTLAPLDPSTLQAGNRALDCDATEIDARVDALLAQMTIQQKVAEMHGAAFLAVDDLYNAGGDTALGIPAFKMVDGPRGVRAGKATAFPVGIARGATFDPELERRVGLAIGLETAHKGANVLLAPTMNVLRHPGWGRAQETYSEDSFHMGVMASAFIGGAQNHVLASAKHFAANSVENSRFMMSSNMSERTLREVYLPHFRRAVQEAGVASVMSAYNRVNGTYCAENTHLLTDILKGEWGFRGFVESDWVLGVHSTVASAQAGLDIEMPVENYFGAKLVAAVDSGELDVAVIDAAVRRVLRQKFCFGLDVPTAVDDSVIESAEHVALAREVSEKSIVLLKNVSDMLPLSKQLRRVAVIGALSNVANLGDRGSSSVTPTSAVGPLEGLRATAPDVEFIPFATDEPTDAELAEIATADAAIVIAGLTYLEEGEYIPFDMGSGLAKGGDRIGLELPTIQQSLITRVASRAKKTVVVLEAGSAVTMRGWVDQVDTLVMAWYPGMQGGAALARVLFGDVNPSGKLPVTFARSMAQLPPWDIESNEVDYDYLHGYRLLDENDEAPEFAFGFGLTYTKFAMGRLALDRSTASAPDAVTVSVDVHNAGTRVGDEIIQLYVSYPSSDVPRSKSELRAFRRVSLEPGEVKTVQLELRPSDLAYFDEPTSTWVTQRGDYTLRVGTSSRDLPLATTLRVE